MSSLINLKKASYIEAADELVHTMPPLMLYDDILHFFNGKYYEQLTDTKIGKAIHDLYVSNGCPDAWTPAKQSAITTAFKYSPTIKEAEEVNNYPDHINLDNGILEVLTQTLIPHSPDFFFTAVSPVAYDPTQTSHPTFDKFLSTVFTNDDLTPDQATINNIIQLGGYLIYRQIKMEKMFIFYGGGSNGKSILIDYIFKPFFPRKFTSSLSLNILSDENSFNREPLIYSMVNFATEQKAADMESDELKKIITGEDIEIFRKHNPKPLNHRPNIKLLVSGNRFMRFKDTSEGLRRRLMIFNFQNRFETNPAKYAKIVNPKMQRIFPAGNKDDLVNNLKQELPAILNTFLKGLKTLKENNWQFTDSENNQSVYKEYLNESDYIGTWLEETFVVDNDKSEYHTAKDILLMYKGWWEYNFPDKKFDTSTKLIGRRIKEIFRVDSQKVNISINGNMSSTTSYSLKLIKDELWEQIHKTQQQDPIQLSF